MNDRIFYGSLELQQESIQPGTLIPVAPRSEPAPELLPFSDKTLESQIKHQKLLEEWEQRKRSRQIVLPTDDKLVQLRLRELGEPIILFGEQPPERRERLREIMAIRGIDDGMPSVQQYSSRDDVFGRQEVELFYTEGTGALKNARLWIAKWSLPRAKMRIAKEKKDRAYEETHERMVKEEEKERFQQIRERVSNVVNISSQVGDQRPLTYIQFSPDCKKLATSAWSGQCRIWDAQTCEELHVMKGHTDRATSIVFHPSPSSTSTVNLASASVDMTAMLWSLDSSHPLATLRAHTHRVNRAVFHPSGRYLATTSVDKTWHLWDVETTKDLMEQEGHSRSVYGVGFQGDGALVATGGQDAIGRIWDLRTGKSVWVMRGHSKQILGIDFAPNGHQLASCSEDHTIRIWELRKRRLLYTIPAHDNIVSSMKYHPSGDIIISSSFDGKVKLWSGIDFTPIKSISANESKVVCADISDDFKVIATANYDRTWRLFTRDDTANGFANQENEMDTS